MKNMNGTTNRKMANPDRKYEEDAPLICFEEQIGEHLFSCFTTTRHGGVSQGEYASFNLGAFCGDNPEAVFENRRRCCERLALAPEMLFVPHQVHGSRIQAIDADFVRLSGSERLKRLDGADALVTSLCGVGIGITTADCVPVVFYSPRPAVIAAAHAGWRGTAQNIAAGVVQNMQTAFQCEPGQIRAMIFSCISQDVYEVSEEVVAKIEATGVCRHEIAKAAPRPGKYYLDLLEANRIQLLKAGVAPQHILIRHKCTYTHPFLFSARRQGLNSGRMLSGAVMRQRQTDLS